MTLYEEQEAAMTDYSGRVVMTTHALRGHANLLSSVATDQADITDDNNFYHFLASHVQISSIETSLNSLSAKSVLAGEKLIATYSIYS
jgi:hypothetical protein